MEKRRGAPIKQKNPIIGLRINEVRKCTKIDGKKLTTIKLAEMLGVTETTIRNWEKNRNMPSKEQLMKIAEICDCTYEYLIGEDPETLIKNAREILNNFNPSKWKVIERPSMREESKIYALVYSLQMCGYKWDDIYNKDTYFEYMEASIRNSIEFYMNTLNKEQKESEEKENEEH